MIKEAENIILNKQYYELSADELATVSELVANAEEFEDMKWFLASTQQALVSEKVDASPELKKKVMEHLNQPRDKRRFWLNGVIPFLLPEDKKFYQKPAFQMSIAALLVIGFFMISNNSFRDSTVALNDGKMIEDKVGGEKSGELIEEVEEISSTIVEEPIPSGDFEDGEVGNTRIVDDVVTFETVEAEEIDEIAHDGYYTGPMTEDDLKKIEDSKDKSNKDLNATGTNFGDNRNNNNNGASKVENTIVPAIVEVDDETVVTTNKNNVQNNPGTSGKSDKKEDVKGKRKFVKKDRGLKKNKSYSNNETVESPVVNQNLGGGFDNNYRDDDDKVLTELDDEDMPKEELKEKSYKEIRPFSAHVNETKELKKLFTVYK